jgi:hypothetical protein
MKVKLEQVLLKEAKETGGGAELSDVESIIKYYLDDSGFRNEAMKLIPGMKTTPLSGMQNWTLIPIWIGLIYRAHNDGFQPMQMLGLTNEQANQFTELCAAIRVAAAGYKKQNPNTPTSQLYAQVRQLGF